MARIVDEAVWWLWLCLVRTLDVQFLLCLLACSSFSLSLSLSLAVFLTCCLSFGQSAASLLTLHNLASRCVTNLPQDYCLTLSACAAVPARFSSVSVLFFFVLSVLQLKCSPLSSDILLVYFRLSVKHVCFVVVVMCLLCLCFRSHLLFSERAICQPSQTFLCFSAWDVLLLCVWCLFAFLSLSASLFLLHSRSWYNRISYRLESKYHCILTFNQISCGVYLQKCQLADFQNAFLWDFTGALSDEWLSSTSIGNRGLAAALTAGAAYGSL